MITFRPLTPENMEQVRLWRNLAPETLRTPFLLTAEQQQQYYRDVICDRRSTTRYWGFWDTEIEYDYKEYRVHDMIPSPKGQKNMFVGYGGLENIQWENRLAEISILIGPEFRGQGYGAEAVEAILRRGFCELNLENIWGECYYCSPAPAFWKRLVERFHGTWVDSPGPRKFWDGKYHKSVMFNFYRGRMYA